MSIINNRPLTIEGLSDVKSPAPLRPNQILNMKPDLALPPPGKFVKEDLYLRKRWGRVQFLAEQFWSRWRSEYLIGQNKCQK